MVGCPPSNQCNARASVRLNRIFMTISTLVVFIAPVVGKSFYGVRGAVHPAGLRACPTPAESSGRRASTATCAFPSWTPGKNWCARRDSNAGPLAPEGRTGRSRRHSRHVRVGFLTS
jgi:hypothetical protein